MQADIVVKVNSYMQTVTDGEGQTSPSLSEEFGQHCAELFAKRFGKPEPREFTLRPSNLGRPHCQLIADKEKWPREPEQYDFVMKMFVGDMVEAAAYSIMKAAGVNIQEKSTKVQGNIFGLDIKGEIDLVIDGKIYDVKSMSKWAFEHKTGSVKDFIGDGDPFGYLGQAFVYSELRGLPFGGWVCICKETGQWTLVEVSDEDHPVFREEALGIVRSNIEAVGKPFSRAFHDEVETFRKKPTGNRVLNFTCGFCPFKWKCWPGLQMLPSLASEAKNKPTVYYTHVDEKWTNKDG